VINVEWFVPGVVASLIVGFAASGRVGRLLGARRIVARLLVVSLGVILSATLTPVRDALETSGAGVGVCDLTRIGPAPLAELGSINDTSLNIALFLPLGLAVGLLPRGRRAAMAALAAASLPFVIEGIQLVATPLHRGCQGADVSDNLTGLFVGLVIGLGLRFGLRPSPPPVTGP